ncbi:MULTISPECIES: hypothetical protein [Chryseobacterium]|uniref:hypothetical protein n=1 Tax=Chryseobacterium TaxID=59732 RepID=UPI0024E2584E|nr:hypothetical protein [Chryseobacterium sp.]
MTQKQKYSLEFVKIKHPEFSDSYISNSSSNIPGSGILSDLLTILSNREPQYLLDEINLALNGGNYEEYYTPDGGISGSIKISPPNVSINGFIIKLSDLKQLLQEWIVFIKL